MTYKIFQHIDERQCSLNECFVDALNLNSTVRSLRWDSNGLMKKKELDQLDKLFFN